jgi:hypothetical protein
VKPWSLRTLVSAPASYTIDTTATFKAWNTVSTSKSRGTAQAFHSH